MKKRILAGGLLTAALVLAGCEEGTIVYDGEERPISEVEDIIGDTLEVENPGLDIDADIFLEEDE